MARDVDMCSIPCPMNLHTGCGLEPGLWTDERERGQRIFLAFRSCTEIPHLLLGVVGRASKITAMTK